MAKYYMFGKYTAEAVKNVSAERTRKIADIVEKLGGKTLSIDMLLGEKDIVIAVDLPDTKSVAKASIQMTKLTGIGFAAAPAISAEEFDKIIS